MITMGQRNAVTMTGPKRRSDRSGTITERSRGGVSRIGLDKHFIAGMRCYLSSTDQ